jgi:hypothetical protein
MGRSLILAKVQLERGMAYSAFIYQRSPHGKGNGSSGHSGAQLVRSVGHCSSSYDLGFLIGKQEGDKPSLPPNAPFTTHLPKKLKGNRYEPLTTQEMYLVSKGRGDGRLDYVLSHVGRIKN